MKKARWPARARSTRLQAMQPLKAHVHNGRIVLDDKDIELHEGDAFTLTPVENMAVQERDDGDDLDDEERELLHQAIDRGLEDGRMGRVVDVATVMAELRAARTTAAR